MNFSSQYQNFDQDKDQLKKRFNVSDITNDTPNEPQDSKKHFEKAKGEFDIFSNSISNELAGSVQSAFLYETTVAARITVNKYLNRRMRNDLKYCLDAWKSKVLQVSKSAIPKNIEYDILVGIDFSIVTNSRSNKERLFLLKRIGIPFQNNFYFLL